MKLNRYLLWTVFVFFSCNLLRAQNNVGIGIQNPDPSAILHLNDNSKGLLIPRMDSDSRKAIVSPANGLMVFDNSVNCFYYYQNTSAGWTSMCPQGGPNPYNTSLSYDSSTSILSLTDGGGTLKANLTPLRADVTLTQDISTVSVIGQTYTFNPMPGMSITFTPNKSVVYVMATTSGESDASNQTTTQAMSIRIQDVTNSGAPIPVVGGSCLSSTSFPNGVPKPAYGYGWNISLSASYPVTPGVPVTLQMQWAPSNYLGGLATVGKCNPITDPNNEHCHMLVFE